MHVSLAFLQLQLPLIHSLVHLHVTISRHALGIGGSVIGCGAKVLSMYVHPMSVTWGRMGESGDYVFPIIQAW